MSLFCNSYNLFCVHEDDSLEFVDTDKFRSIM